MVINRLVDGIVISTYVQDEDDNIVEKTWGEKAREAARRAREAAGKAGKFVKKNPWKTAAIIGATAAAVGGVGYAVNQNRKLNNQLKDLDKGLKDIGNNVRSIPVDDDARDAKRQATRAAAKDTFDTMLENEMSKMGQGKKAGKPEPLPTAPIDSLKKLDDFMLGSREVRTRGQGVSSNVHQANLAQNRRTRRTVTDSQSGDKAQARPVPTDTKVRRKFGIRK